MIGRITLVSVLIVATCSAEAQVSRKTRIDLNTNTPTPSLSRTTMVLPTPSRSNLSFTGTRRRAAARQLPRQVPGRTWTRRDRPVYQSNVTPRRRPVVNNQTVVNRPAIQNIVNNVTNVTNINNNQTTLINNNYANQNINYGNQNVVNSQRWRGRYDHLHGGWHAGHWNFAYQPSMWVAGTSGMSWATAAGGGYNFVNPYFNSAIVLGGVDYSRPIYSGVSQYGGSVTEEAVRRLNAARDAFRRQDYRRSLQLVEDAIQVLPEDPILHESRALCLFALGDYENAAAVLYPVLAAGPGSDWDSVSVLYPSSDVYVDQLTDLSQFIARHPDDAAARFLFAYHLLVVGRPADAYVQLREVLLRRPNDVVAMELVRALQQRS